MAAAARTGAEQVDAYLRDVPQPQRDALEALRRLIRAAAPEAEEALVYGAPGFRQDGALVCYAARSGRCSFFPMSPALLDSLGDDLNGIRTSKGTLGFTSEAPLDPALVRRIIVARVDENRAKAKTKTGR